MQKVFDMAEQKHDTWSSGILGINLKIGQSDPKYCCNNSDNGTWHSVTPLLTKPTKKEEALQTETLILDIPPALVGLKC